MNHKHRKTLHALFAHPVSANINYQAVVHVLQELGATIDNKSGNRIGVTLNEHTVAFTHVSHDLPKNEVAQVKKFLETCGVEPGQYPI